MFLTGADSKIRIPGYTLFLIIGNTFISKARLKLAKNQANAKKHPEAELLLFEKNSHASSTLSSKNNRKYSKKQAKEQVCLYSWDYTVLIIMKMKKKKKNRSHRYTINRPRSRHGHKYCKYKKCLILIMLTCTEQHPKSQATLGLSWKKKRCL